MNNNLFFNKRENAVFITILGLILLSLYQSDKYLIILMYWTLSILIIGNLKRIHSKKKCKFILWLRRTCFVIPYLLPFAFHTKLKIASSGNLQFYLIAAVIPALFLMPKYNEWKLYLSSEYLMFKQKQTLNELILNTLFIILMAISEELFFRYFIISTVLEHNLIIAIFVSCTLFYMNHFSLLWNESFTIYDYVIQLLFGVVSSVMFILSGSILYSVIMHILYNLPRVIIEIKSYFVQRTDHNLDEEY